MQGDRDLVQAAASIESAAAHLERHAGGVAGSEAARCVAGALSHLDAARRAVSEAASAAAPAEPDEAGVGDALHRRTGTTGMLIDDIPLCVLTGRAGKGVTAVNRRWTEMTRLTSVASLGDGWLDGFEPGSRQSLLDSIEAVLAGGGDMTGEWQLSDNGAPGPWVRARLGLDSSGSGDGVGWTLVFVKVDRSEDDIAELVRRASHDALTGIANRELLADRTRHALAKRGRPPESVAMLFIDLDAFKGVNEVHGHGGGDSVLRTVADRLASVVRTGDTFARIGGDEFAVLCEDLAGRKECLAVVERLLDAASTTVVIGSARVSVSASIGVAFAEGATDTFDGLLDRADKAMFKAKAMGGGRYQVSPSLSSPWSELAPLPPRAG